MSTALQANYDFMKKSPVYLELKDKYKALKKRNEQLVEMMLDMRALCEELKRNKKDMLPVEIKQEPVEPIREKTIVVIDEEDIIMEITQEEVVVESDEQEEVVEEQSEEESEEVVEEESEEVVEEESEEVVEEESEEVVEEESEEVVEEESEEESEEVVEEVVEEEEGVYEIEIDGERYYTTNEQNGIVYAVVDEDDVGDQIGYFQDGVFHLGTQ